MCLLSGALGVACGGTVEGSASIGGEGGQNTAGADSSTGGNAGTSTGGRGGAGGMTSSTGGSGGMTSGTGGTGGTGGGAVAGSARTSAKVYYFGHSLVDHSEPNTQVGSAMCSIAASSGHSCCADGEYPARFDPSAFGNYPLPPEPGQAHEPSCTEDWNGSYAASNLDTVVITEANFFYDGSTDASVSAGRELVNNIRATDPSIPVFLYEHWPELEGGVSFDSWKSTDYRKFGAWFEAVQDGINSGDIDGADIKLIPAGRVFTRLLRDVPALAALGQDDLFVDTDPHGTPITYFLSGIAHYMAIYGRKPATDGTAIDRLPSYLPEAVRDNYAQIIDTAWDELQAVNAAGGEVF